MKKEVTFNLLTINLEDETTQMTLSSLRVSDVIQLLGRIHTARQLKEPLIPFVQKNLQAIFKVSQMNQ